MFRLSPTNILSLSVLSLVIFPTSIAQVPQGVAQPCINSKSDTGSVPKPDCAASSKSTKRLTVEFEGLQAFATSDVLKALREDQAALPEDRMPTEAEIEKTTAALKKVFKSRGYYDATINFAPINDSLLRIVVNEGTRFSIGIVSFEGNRKISSDELSAKLQQYLAKFSASLKAGYDEETFAYCHRLLLNSIRSRGYLQAKYLEPRITPSGLSLNITVPIDEGPTYKLGKVTIEGASVFSPTELEALFPIRETEIANAEKIGNWLYEHLRDAYAEKGFIQCTSEIEPKFRSNPKDDEDGIVDFLITIDEGKRFTVGSISFRGDQPSPNEINSLFLLRPGDFYNQQLFDESVRRLNSSGAFEELDRYKDSSFATNGEDATVAIVFTMKRKARN